MIARLHRSLAATAIGMLATMSPQPALALGANYTKPGFAISTASQPTVLVLYPDWFIGSLTSKGESEINPDWAAATFENMQRALRNGPVGHAVELRFMTAEESLASPILTDARESFKWRTSEMIFRVPQGTMPVTAGKKGAYPYTIGADLAGRIRQAHGDADYALLVIMHDSYATIGQKFSSILGATAVGMVTPQGSAAPGRPLPPHFGNAMLVDLRDGAVVWFHGDGAFGGDPRTPAGAVKRMAQAMEHFPGTDLRR